MSKSYTFFGVLLRFSPFGCIQCQRRCRNVKTWNRKRIYGQQKITLRCILRVLLCFGWYLSEPLSLTKKRKFLGPTSRNIQTERGRMILGFVPLHKSPLPCTPIKILTTIKVSSILLGKFIVERTFLKGKQSRSQKGPQRKNRPLWSKNRKKPYGNLDFFLRKTDFS